MELKMENLCNHCLEGKKLYPAGTHNLGKGTWQVCGRVKYESDIANPWHFRILCFSERAAKSVITKYRNRGLAAGWAINRTIYPKFYAIFTDEVQP